MSDLFKTAPKEVTRYFDSKGSVPTFDWRDIAPDEHAFTFTVAKTAGFDVLDDIHDELARAVRDQVPFEEFRQSLTPTLQKKGWWGRAIATDPKTGVPDIVQLGSPHRLKTIYWANTRTAYAAGEWERTQRNKAFLPFILYQRTIARDPRDEHLGFVGIVLPVEHPFWETHYPPNGWGCECTVRQISRREAIALGWSEDQEEPVVVFENWKNKRTGKTEKVPRGIDPGWAQNPGKNRAKNVSSFLSDRVAALPGNRRTAAIEDIVGSPLLKAMYEKPKKGMFLPIAPVRQDLAQALGAEPSFVRLSSDSLQHMINERKERGLTLEDMSSALTVAANPEAAIPLKSKKGFTYLGEANGKKWRLVVKAVTNVRSGETEWWLNSFHRKTRKEIDRIVRRAERDGTLLK
ncbi:phage head morphogenesis protein [Martelella mediterranea]|uniref:Phage Mu protein F like protein n=1 Tax=Martelella mediterranea TaxID=293089 RepID=A0A4R3NY98_9HYPH|nr:phage minor head protein [Martelella mediterranea]TCT39615.1 phage Mu protein F like protein [Martelella mediterranea]